MEEATKIRLNTQSVEVVPARLIGPGTGRIFASACVQPRLRAVISYQIFKTVIAIPQIEIVGIGLAPRARVRSPERVKVLALGHFHRMQ